MNNSNLPNFFAKLSEDGKIINDPVTDPEKIKELQALQKYVTSSLELVKYELEKRKQSEK